MPPKTPAPPPLEPAGAVDALTSADPQVVVNALNVLNSGEFPKEREAQVNLAVRLTDICKGSEPANALAAALLLVKLSKQPETASVCSSAELVQGVWQVFNHFHVKFDAYKAALSQLQSPDAAAAAAKAKDKAPKGIPPTDPESTLPGPSKAVMDILQRFLTSSAQRSTTVADVLSGCSCQPWLTVLKHHSCRLQAQGLILVRALLNGSSRLCNELLMQGAVEVLEALVQHSSSAGVRYEAIITLSHLLDPMDAALEYVCRGHVVDSLLQLLMEPTTGGAAASSGTDTLAYPAESQERQPSARAGGAPSRGGASPATPGTAPPNTPPLLNFAQPIVCTPEQLQVASAQLLQQLVADTRSVATHLIHMGGVQLLLAMLPRASLPDIPPLPPPPPEDKPKRGSAASKTIFASLAHPKPSTPEPEPEPNASAGHHNTGPHSPEPHQGHHPSEEHQAEDAWAQYLTTAAYPMPAQAPSAEVQHNVLLLLAALLAEPGVRSSLWRTHSTTRTHLHLLHLLRTAPVPALPAEAPHMVEPSVATKPAAKGLSAAPAKAGKDAKAPAPPETPPPRPSHLEPPFPACVQAGALECLRQLSVDKRWAILLSFCKQVHSTFRDTGGLQPCMMQPLAGVAANILMARQPAPGAALLRTYAAGDHASSDGPAQADTLGPIMLSAASASASSSAPPNPQQAHQQQETAASDAGVAWQQCNQADNLLSREANGLVAGEVPLRYDDITTALKWMAGQAVANAVGDTTLHFALSNALMLLPEEALVAPPRPPPPSPPATPPPPPLPTSQFLWDALGRPAMTDGIALAHV